MKPIDALLPLGVAAIAAPLIMQMLRRIQSAQNVSAHLEGHQHKQGTPTMGGLIILAGVMASVFFTLPHEARWPVLALTLGFGLVGFVDDYVIPRSVQGSRGLEWKSKLIMQLVSGGVALFVGGYTDVTAIVVGLLAILFMANAYNFADGLDALAGGLGVMLAAGLGAFAWATGNEGLILTMVALGVSFFPFLAYNRPKAKVFMGDVGALPIGAIFGWGFFSLAWTNERLELPLLAPLAILALVMIIELVPVPLQIASVKIRKKRLFNFKTPIHHGLEDTGMSERKVVFTLYIVQAVAVGAAMALIPDLRTFAPAAIALLLLGLLLGFPGRKSADA